jgi:hypothetical protein
MSMAWQLRAGLFAFGLFLILTGKVQLDAGHWVFLNASYRQTTFAAGAYGVGAVFCLLAFLPPDNWMYRHITTRLPMRDNLRPWPRRRKR